MMHNGPEFRGRTLDLWAYETGVKLHFIEPGIPCRTDLPKDLTAPLGTSA